MATTTQYYRYNALTRVLTAEPRYIVTLDGQTLARLEASQTNVVEVIVSP